MTHEGFGRDIFTIPPNNIERILKVGTDVAAILLVAMLINADVLRRGIGLRHNQCCD